MVMETCGKDTLNYFTGRKGSGLGGVGKQELKARYWSEERSQVPTSFKFVTFPSPIKVVMNPSRTNLLTTSSETL